MVRKLYEVLAKGVQGKKAGNSTCITYPLIKSRVWADFPKQAEDIFAELHEGEVDEIFHRDTKEIEPTAEELAEEICREDL